MKLHKRIRRKLLGAKVEIRVYEDGTLRCRVDDPSNDPGTEIAIAGLLIKELGTRFDDAGIGPLRPTGPLTWKDDPA